MDTKDLADKFSLRDILSYLLPGAFGTTGIFIFLATTPLNLIFAGKNYGISKIILLIIVSYPLGIIFSAFSVAISNYILKKRRLIDPRNVLPPDYVDLDFLSAFNETFGLNLTNADDWDSKYFYMCRIWVDENFPITSRTAYKQNQLLHNL